VHGGSVAALRCAYASDPVATSSRRDLPHPRNGNAGQRNCEFSVGKFYSRHAA
jgi:hypothetical protein